MFFFLKIEKNSIFSFLAAVFFPEKFSDGPKNITLSDSGELPPPLVRLC